MPIFNINSDVQTVKFTEYAPAPSLGPLWDIAKICLADRLRKRKDRRLSLWDCCSLKNEFLNQVSEAPEKISSWNS